jgi:hypothetical protein
MRKLFLLLMLVACSGAVTVPNTPPVKHYTLRMQYDGKMPYLNQAWAFRQHIAVMLVDDAGNTQPIPYAVKDVYGLCPAGYTCNFPAEPRDDSTITFTYQDEFDVSFTVSLPEVDGSIHTAIQMPDGQHGNWLTGNTFDILVDCLDAPSQPCHAP